MRTLHLYLTRQVLATLVMTVTVVTFVMLLANVLHDIMGLLINRQASLGLVFEAFALLIPWVLAFSLPMGMLTAALLVFGRFSADQELTAVRSSGISLVTLVSPILVLSLLLCGLSAWVNLEIAPRCRVAYIGIREHVRAKMAAAILPDESFIRDIPHYLIYIGRKHDQDLSDIRIYKLDDNQKLKEITVAARGQLVATNDNPFLHLEDVQKSFIEEDGQIKTVYVESVNHPLEFKASTLADNKPALTDMTFSQLQAELRSLDQNFSLPNSRALNSDELRATLSRLAQEKRDMTTLVLVQIHRQLAASFACFGFTLIGIPLGIRAHRRETSVGFFIALGLVFVYYCLIVLGQSLQGRPDLAPHLIVWIPNFLFQTVGAVMLWRANRGI